MGNKSGDYQSRVELLGKLLLACGEEPYMLRHGSGRSVYHLILLRTDKLGDAKLVQSGDASGTTVKVGPYEFIALPIGEGGTMGLPDSKYYNPKKKRWTAAIALSRVK